MFKLLFIAGESRLNCIVNSILAVRSCSGGSTWVRRKICRFEPQEGVLDTGIYQSFLLRSGSISIMARIRPGQARPGHV